MSGLRDFSTAERVKTPYHDIDPGFINKRLIFSTFSSHFIDQFNQFKRDGNDHWAELANNHIIVDLSLAYCRNLNVRSLSEVLVDIKVGDLFCSTERIEGSDEVYDDGRKSVRILLPYEYDKEIILVFGTEHFVSSTGRSEVAEGEVLSIIGGIRNISESQIIVSPLIIGAPSFDHQLNRGFPVKTETLAWCGWDWYEIFTDDIKEFSKVMQLPEPSAEEWSNVMSKIRENEIKNAFTSIIGDVTRKDWGGELADHFSSSVHLSEERVTAAFLLKGPADFREMTPDMLGKRADQIYRLAQTPAQLLIVQHCHQIGEAVRATLRVFAVTPHNPRRYCLIDGKDTYKILRAYDVL